MAEKNSILALLARLRLLWQMKKLAEKYLLFPIASLIGAILVFCLKRYEAHQNALANEEEDERDWAYFDTKETTLGGLQKYESQMSEPRTPDNNSRA
jgi:hypothetical protein